MIIEGSIFSYKKKIKQLFAVAEELLNENFENVNVSINFVDKDEIKMLNNKFRQIDKVTDVLSFPNLNKTTSQKLVEFDAEKDEDGILFLGDIVVCKDVAYAQAKEFGHSKKREVCFLVLHSLLHLLGYDHIEPEDEKIMIKKADEIMAKFGVNR